MKPAPFAYYAPSSVADALDAISRADDPEDLKVLAGGQSLVPMLNLRLAQPGTLLDINGLGREWRSMELDPATVRVGALVRQRAAERSAAVTQWCPLVAEALPQVAHVQIRTRGTIGGSIAHADPAAELPAVALALDAQLHITGPRGERSVPASGFFQGFFTTALAPDELLSRIDFPRLPAGNRDQLRRGQPPAGRLRPGRRGRRRHRTGGPDRGRAAALRRGGALPGEIGGGREHAPRGRADAGRRAKRRPGGGRGADAAGGRARLGQLPQAHRARARQEGAHHRPGKSAPELN